MHAAEPAHRTGPAERVLPDGDTLRRRCRIVVADGRWDRAAITGYLKEHPW
ncbi:hypothetical protein [Streptomyces sp. TRM68367]|uniref:hypothetical protein n=1 Tax=Streptomyces sp. TRM68367 TaxID=2758415 RepID=UPI00165BFA59|nr:hypothetical protein [Streptomyces sp. TRM68367]MBC9727261.1 hypothetical protein [Streptomyces sp. TRM68367]